MITGSECLRLVVPGQRDFAAQHHDPRVEVMRVQVLGEWPAGRVTSEIDKGAGTSWTKAHTRENFVPPLTLAGQDCNRL
ncbi:MAG TPA: hypothetical protein VE690_04320 [Rhodopila sp.]|nr:hypothetical protein [Rhodopila sp.]